MSFLQEGITSNYSIAKSYYSQKRKAVEEFLNSKAVGLSDAVVLALSDKAKEYVEKIAKRVYAEVGISGSTGAVPTGSIKASTDNAIVNGILSKLAKFNSALITRQNVAAVLGNEFEGFLQTAFNEDGFINASNLTANNALSQLLAGFTLTGQSLASKKSFIAPSKNIRLDLGFNIEGDKESGAFVKDKNNNNLSVELETVFQLDKLALAENIDEAIKTDDILSLYLQSNTFGYGVKIWESGNKEFSKSTALLNYINEKFLSSNGNTWESNYANEYAVYQVSNLLLNIIGPLNVAMITGTKFTWMDDYLDTHLFYMNVQCSKEADSPYEKSTRGSGYEVHPVIKESSIYNRMSNSNHIIARAFLSKKTGKLVPIMAKSEVKVK